jgi:hypothetical protein
MAVNYAQNGNTESAIGLLRKLMDEIALASAEFSNSMRKLVAASTSVAAGGVVLFGGFLALLAAAVLGLANVVSPWLAALIVGLVVGLIGTAMVMTGIKALKPDTLKPARSVESLKEDKDVLMRKDT